MKKYLVLIVLLLMSEGAFAQESDLRGFTETKIESGSIFRKYEKGKLDSIIVFMKAMNYGNALIFSRTKDAIIIKNANDEDSFINIELKNKKQIKSFYFKNKSVATIQALDFDRQNFPKNKLITISLDKNKISIFAVESKLDSLAGQIDDKSLKLFYRLNIPSDLNNLDSVLDYIGDFFTEEDGLLKIFYGSYAEEQAPKSLGYLQTDDFGKIEEGVLWDFEGQKLDQKNRFEVYKAGKLLKFGTSTIDEFQKIFRDYIEKSWENK